MCRAIVIIFFPVFVVTNGIALPTLLIDMIFTNTLGAIINFGEAWVCLIILQFLNSIYGLMLVCAKSELRCILIPWAFQSFSINIIFFFWTILYSQDISGSFDATGAITFVFMEAFGISTLYVVCGYYNEFIEKLSWNAFQH